MNVEQIYTNCLAEAAYYITSNGEAAVIDPLRESEPYLERLERDGVKLKYIFETHYHADFVSGHLDLAKKTGATIVYGPNANPVFEAHEAVDNEEFTIGDVRIRVLHTPGHTQESSTFLLIDENDEERAIFTGDTLFLGDVGRPDLAIKTDLTQEDLAGMLFDSLRNKIMTLPDSITVYPGHGAGSSCGKNLSSDTVDILGNQKRTNYALRESMTKEEFIKEVTEGLAPPPQYFPENAKMNKFGYDSVDEVMERGMKALTPAEVASEIEAGALVLDTRSADAFAASHIPNSMFIGIDGNFAMWVGALITNLKRRIVFLAPEGREEEVVRRLARVGYDHAVGYLKGGMEAWTAAGKEDASTKSISAVTFEERYAKGETNVVDVRKEGEYNRRHIEGAQLWPLDDILREMGTLDREKQMFVHCAGGYRSMIAMSMLEAEGYTNLTNVEGGFKAIEALNHVPLTDEVTCASTAQ
ncbi:MAG: MBL fold metallo-hydrolase [Bacteroidetes bacterium]|uniref:MBL fold metallo-hydrolase n=1 Tax=Phaeocystidibacter marisrubri TaxID=1577780 RepID=A0A6L3ZIK0_9FLAO|nr:MBL fold metallo-hydrolase [Phaeocystidibacter marisrubri]KAB2817836.1 MBL fold metallo-hydrolase [Phaeocystidibacter marisrubri]TNE29472.1 MAG: MBL fold metallo-hydrolase [Bacteroidota bacterium]GGH73276.1 MBL fold metallo-hydrolase [Phaeocystidibacter marisrubri]